MSFKFGITCIAVLNVADDGLADWSVMIAISMPVHVTDLHACFVILDIHPVVVVRGVPAPFSPMIDPRNPHHCAVSVDDEEIAKLNVIARDVLRETRVHAYCLCTQLIFLIDSNAEGWRIGLNLRR